MRQVNITPELEQ